MRHAKLLVHWEQPTDKHVLFNVRTLVQAYKDNKNLKISEVRVEAPAVNDVLVKGILIALARLRFPEPPRVWFKFQVRSTSLSNAVFEYFFHATGARDCSDEWEGQGHSEGKMSSTENRPTNVCHLFRLPTQVRKRILYHLFSRDWDYCDKLQITPYGNVYLTTSTRPTGLAGADNAAILRTSRLLHDEGLPVLYDCSKFIVTILCDTIYDEQVDGLPLGFLASTQPIWRHMRHVKLIVHWEQLTKKLLFVVNRLVHVLRENTGLNISELKVANMTGADDFFMELILKSLALLRYPEPPKVWLKFSDVRTARSLDVVLEHFRTVTGGRNCSDEFQEEEDRLQFPLITIAAGRSRRV
ncbi:hypothetical protein PRZ48_006019 [Zasmidium cellare]|uniref:Uncharacterized protein n=1 Tax=Zasmidium cellare TaxID=395010 RepID=A0ABR0EN04_ZASCE|nr:hypothetical protein PRZ48_006019 [Zasmidium cellare]